MRRFNFLLIGLCLLASNALMAHHDPPVDSPQGEGMWIPMLLKQLNEAEMQSMGMKLTAEQIYSVNNGSIKDAIVHFGGFCTSEIISEKGLLLTNHHCGYGQIQQHTTLENNYLEDGFWAMKQGDELPNPGLTATFIDRIKDVTKDALIGVSESMDSKERQSVIDKNLSKIKSNTTLADHEEIVIKPFFHGNQYFMFVTVTYKDVRLVGAPPSSIGKFGADTDNWEWPRHTGDFSLFRIYAGKNNMPAEYSKDNVPYRPKHFLPISLDGVSEGDFTMIFGFPGRTQQYLPAVAVEQVVNDLNPARIEIRDAALKILDAEMKADKQVKIQYASKFARIANYWKKWIGESEGLKTVNAIGKKQQLEADFTKLVSTNRTWNKKYGRLLGNFGTLYQQIRPYAVSRDYYYETFSRNIELARIAGYMNQFKGQYSDGGDRGFQSWGDRLSPYLADFYKNYNRGIDEKVFTELVQLFVQKTPSKGLVKPVVDYKLKNSFSSYAVMATYLYRNTFLTDEAEVNRILGLPAGEAIAIIEADPYCQLIAALKDAFDNEVATPYNDFKSQIDDNQRIYMKALMEVFPDKRFFPDANSTMRITYGKVEGYVPLREPTNPYHPHTYLDGVIAKYKPGDYEFDVPKKLRELHRDKDYGAYKDKNGKLPVCFLGSNHTTGGNSGSPAIDAHGNLVGLNFDRVWEGTMSDINYDLSLCRNIMVDMRYVLFIIDKFAGADHLISEMKLVRPKTYNNTPKNKAKRGNPNLKIREERHVKDKKFREK